MTTATRILNAIRAAERRGETPSVRQLVSACHLSSTSVARYWLIRLAQDGLLELGPKGHARSYRLTPKGRGAPTRAEELENALRLIRRWIESEETPGARTMDIYNLTAKLLPY